MVAGLPSQYIFSLRCCFLPECPHPLREGGKPNQLLQWFPGGPTVDFIPLHIPDSKRPWDTLDCSDCKGKCSGHIIKPSADLSNVKNAANVMDVPPSVAIREFLQTLAMSPTQEEITKLAKSVLLSEEDVKLWIDHLQTAARNRIRGAARSATTRAVKKQTTYYCGVCDVQYTDETDDFEQWIEWEKCLVWHHWNCVGLEFEPDSLVCSKCLQV